MTKIIDEIKQGLPDIDSKKVEEISNELDNILAVKRIFSSPDGSVLLNTLKSNCYTVLNKLVNYNKLANPDINTYISLVATYSANLDLLSQLQDIKLEQEIRDQLDEAVKEALSQV